METIVNCVCFECDMTWNYRPPDGYPDERPMLCPGCRFEEEAAFNVAVLS